MKVSIVTGTFNSEKYIEDCVASINNQDFKNIEHVIIDGASNDQTVEIIKSIPNRVEVLISEPDEGIYNAMNKGLKNCSGDILGILNSDDFYNANNVISTVVEEFEKTQADCVFGDLFYVEAENPDNIVRKWVTGPYKNNSFKTGWHPPHPSFFVKKEVYQKFGYFDEELSLAADFELMLRFIEKHKLKTSYIPQVMVRMRLGGATSKSLKNIIRGNKECLKAFKKNDISPSILYPIIRLTPKLKQFIS